MLPKRQIEYSQADTSPIAKKARTEEKKPSTLSSLLNKVKTDASATKTLNLDVDKSTASAAKESPRQQSESKMKNGDHLKTGKCWWSKLFTEYACRPHAKRFFAQRKRN